MTDENISPRWISDHAGVEQLAQELAQATCVALDTESNSRFVYQERVCLLQLNLDGDCVLVDTLALPAEPAALAPLKSVLEDPDSQVLLHGAEYDVACMKRDYDISLAGVFDTQQAASFLGMPRTGYGNVVNELLDISLPKQHSQYNWGRRPIDDAALRYALDDVKYLPQIASALQERIAAADLEEEMAIANAAVMAAAPHSSGYDPKALFRIKGIGKLRSRQLGLAFALFTWRDDQAKAVDMPPGMVINNESLLKLAMVAPTNFGLLKRQGIHPRSMKRFGDSLLACIKATKENPPTPPEPPARKDIDPSVRDREDKLKSWRRQEAERRKVPLQVVLPARALDYLAKNPDAELNSAPQMGQKRCTLYGKHLRKLLT